jgi:hypothetical protein
MIKFRIAIYCLLTLMGIESASAQIFETRLPIYIVNGERMSEEEVKAIHPADIVSNELLTVDEAVIEKYGHDAANGVVVITLRYDTPARFEVDGEDEKYSTYIAERVKWSEIEDVARVVISFTVEADGSVTEKDVLEATDRRLLARIRKAMEEAPKWVPAKLADKGVQTDHILRITLPMGRRMPREGAIIIR